jgi:hypothetical protein
MKTDEPKDKRQSQKQQPIPGTIYTDSELDPKSQADKDLLDATMADHVKRHKERQPRVFNV